MYCPNCGSHLSDETRFCPGCGRSLAGTSSPSVSFGEAIKRFFAGYLQFHGRARRSEFWFAFLFTGLVGGFLSSIAPELGSVWSLAIFLPSQAICFRRLHDIGKSGWWVLIGLIPLVGQILLLVWYCRDSDGHNPWGPSPKY